MIRRSTLPPLTAAKFTSEFVISPSAEIRRCCPSYPLREQRLRYFPPFRAVHHIDFAVRDLEWATERYRLVLGREPHEREPLPERGVNLVRFRFGEIWIILVQPTREDSPVMDFLNEHGEGFFHIAYQVDDVEIAGRSLADAGIRLASGGTWHRVEGWKLLDLDIAETLGVMTQLVEPKDSGPVGLE